MSQKRSNIVERRLFEYTLRAVSSPLHVSEDVIKVDELISHVATLFNVDLNETAEKQAPFLKSNPSTIVLIVDVKKARDLSGEDENGLSDPYCKVSVVHNPQKVEPNSSRRSSASSTSPASSPRRSRKNPHLLSCLGVQSSKQHLQPPSSNESRRSSRGSRSSDGSQTAPENHLQESPSKINTVTYRTEVKARTVNPEWNQRFEFTIDDVYEQQLLITVFDSDVGEEPAMRTVLKEKRGFQSKFKSLRGLLKRGTVEDDFLGQISFDIRNLAKYDREQWFPLLGLKKSQQSSNNKSRGEILLGLKVHFKLDERNTFEDVQQASQTAGVHFRRRSSTTNSLSYSRSSIISRPSLFRTNFRAKTVQNRDQTRRGSIQENTRSGFNPIDNILTPIKSNDMLLLTEEYHQLCRITFLHCLEDIRDSAEPSSDLSALVWDGNLTNLSNLVLAQFRVLYDISPISECFIQLLVVLELRCSQEYNSSITQNVIDKYLRGFLEKIPEPTDGNGFDLTDYEKSSFKEILQSFIAHYQERVDCDAPWFLPSENNFENVNRVFETFRSLIELRICSNETAIRTLIEEIVKKRLAKDIATVFDIEPFDLNEKNETQLTAVKDFVNLVKQINESMGTMQKYNLLFREFDINYIKICFFEPGSAADRLAETVKLLLTMMKEYFRNLTKPMIQPTSSIYDPNLIHGSGYLLNLYIYIQRIVASLKIFFEPREWATNAFKMPLINFRQWFEPVMGFLVEGFVVHIRQAMERALEKDDDVILENGSTLYSESALALSNLCIKLCRDWDSVDYHDPNTRYTAMIRLTNTICEQCQYYARRILSKLQENKYYPDPTQTASFNVSKKLCALVNDIEYVKRNVLSSLPSLLNFTDVINRMREVHESPSFDNTRGTLERLMKNAESEMTEVIRAIFEHVSSLVYTSLESKTSSYFEGEQRGRPECIKEVIRYIDQQILQHLYQGLEIVQYSGVARSVRAKTLQCLKRNLKTGEKPEFYSRVLRSFDELSIYFDVVCRDDPQIQGPPCAEAEAFRKLLRENSMTNVELFMVYWSEVSQSQSLQELINNDNRGSIIFRVAHEITNGLVTICVNILSCHNLPKMDVIGSSDPYVVLELLPKSIYHKNQTEYRTVVQKRTLNPEFNEVFNWHRLPETVLKERGAVLRLSVWDQDLVNDDYIGECFVQLSKTVSLKQVAGLRDIPVSEVRLRRPFKNNQPAVFESIRNRALWDKEMEAFVKERTEIMVSGHKNGEAGSSISDDQQSTGSYASAAIRSLLCMMPVNFDFGQANAQ